MDFKISCLSIMEILRISASERFSKISGIFFLNIFLYTYLKIFVSGSWQLFNMRNRFYTSDTFYLYNFSYIYSYLLCIRSFLQEIRFLSLTHIDDCRLCSHWNHLNLSSLFHPFHVAFIYTMNWMSFFFVFVVLCFDEFIIALVF